MHTFAYMAISIAWLTVLSACSMQQRTDTRDLGEGAVLSLTLQPFPLLVGQSADIYATLRYQRAAGTGCRVQYRQFAVDAGATDTVWRDIPEQSRSGIYKIRGLDFNREGRWRFEFNLECGEQLVRRGVVFDYAVAPE
ncbi:MAG: hypothetical protein AABY83_08350 [Pseudomonadota bacterium]